MAFEVLCRKKSFPARWKLIPNMQKSWQGLVNKGTCRDKIFIQKRTTMWKDRMQGGQNKSQNRLDFRLPEAIRTGQQKISLLTTAIPDKPILSPKEAAGKHTPLPVFLPEGQGDSSRFLEQVAQCCDGLEPSPAMQPGLERSIRQYRTLGEQGRLKLAETLQQLGALLREKGDKPSALRCFEESLAILRKLPPSDRAAPLAGGLKQAGDILYGMQRLPEAARYFEEALRISEKNPILSSDSEKLEAAAIATLSAAIRIEQAAGEQEGDIGRRASEFIALSEKYLKAIREEEYLVKKRMEELKYVNRVLRGIIGLRRNRG